MSSWGNRIYQLFSNGAEVTLDKLVNTSRLEKLFDASASNASIETELKALNEKHDPIDVNPVTRLRAYIDRHKSHLSKCSAEISDGHGGTKTINGNPESVKDPAFLPSRSQTYTHEATARHHNKDIKLSLEIRV
jgi:hypothetical protein